MLNGKLQIVEYSDAHLPTEAQGTGLFKTGDVFLLLGEIENMPGHVAVVDRKGRVHWGHGEEYFTVMNEDDV